MRVKRSKSPSGKKPIAMDIEPYWKDISLIQIRVPNSGWNGYSSIEITKKEARRLASALLEYTKSMEG